MSEPTVVCPSCRTEFPLTESLAAPLIAATKRQFEQKLSQKDAEVASREQALREKERVLGQEKRDLELRVADLVEARLNSERSKIAAEETKRAQRATAVDLNAKVREIADLQDALKVRDAKLAEAQEAHVSLIKKERELQAARRELDLTVEKRVQAGLTQVRTRAKQEAEEALNLKVMERDQTISSMQRTIEELKQKAQQGSQQLQGEVQELQLEGLLRGKFPLDCVEPVPKGEFGGDALQRIVSPGGQPAGTILWESKRTKNWSDGWLAKLREDQRSARADLSVLVSQALPKGIDTFDIIDGVWVVHPRVVIPVATVLRQTLMQVSSARQASDDQQTKAELVYRYLTGSRFRQRVEAIVEAFTCMQTDLDRERTVIMKQWAKRQEQIERVIGATTGMYGDLQGLAGASISEIDGLDLEALAFEGDHHETAVAG
jgi:hypothetical protein